MINFIRKRREFILEEKDVTTVLNAVNSISLFSSKCAANCGWGGNEKSKWFIVFYVTDKAYGNIVKKLNTIGKFGLDVRPGGQVDITFERA